MSNSDWDWSKIPDESVREIVRQGEAHLGDMITVSIASDQRGATQAGIFAAISAGLLAAAATVTAAPLATALAVGGAGFLVASLISGFAAIPRDFHATGLQPKNMVAAAEDELWLQRRSAESLQRRIDFNDGVLKRQARLTVWGYWAAIASIVLAVAVYGASCFSSTAPQPPAVVVATVPAGAEK